MANDELTDEDLEERSGGRVEVPLVMLRGNMQCLMENVVPVRGISLKWSNDHVHAVILVVHGLDDEDAKTLGFQTQRVEP